MPTILQIIPRLDTGGAELSTLEITEAVARAGGRMIVLTEGGRLAGEVTRLGGELVTFSAATKNPAVILANARRIAGIVTEHGVDLLHARSRAPAWSALLAARRTGKPFVTTYHGAYGGTGRVKSFYNGVMARGDVVIANSQFTADLVRERHRTPPERLRVIHRGVDLVRFDPAAITSERKDALLRQWGVRPDRRIILQAARVTGWKGQRVLIDAAALLEDAGLLADCVIVLAGDAQGRDGHVDDLRARIAAAGLDPNVLLVGHCADIAAAYQLAYVTAVPSTKPEAFGRVAAEALAMGCPVVVADHGAPPEILRMGARDGSRGDGEHALLGRLCVPGDARTLADGLAEMLAMTPPTRERLRHTARAHVVEHFSSARMQRATLDVYDRLLGSAMADAFDRSATT